MRNLAKKTKPDNLPETPIENGLKKPKRLEELKALVSDFPTTSGVYLMKSKLDKIIYVGKAKNIRSRVRSYFLDSIDISP